MRTTALSLLLLGALPALAQDSLNVRHLFNWDDPDIPVGIPALFNQYNEVWGYAANGREYAFLGSSLGVHVLDVTDPANTVLVDHVPGRVSGEGVIHRDYKVHAGHLYATCDQGPSSLQIMDLQYLPDSVHLVYDSDELLVRAHNIQVDTVHARLYTCGGSTQFSVYSIADPANPVLLSNCEADIPWWGSTVGYVHDCFVRDNIVWCNDEDGMHVIDFSNVNAPVILGSLTDYPDQGYNHSGWMNDAGTLYAMADETHGSPVKLIDATDLSDLEIVSTVTTGVHPTSIVHNPFFTGDLLHAAYYYDGYWLWNTADPAQPLLLGYYDTSAVPNSDGYSGAWGVYPFLPSGNILVSDMQTGLWVLDIGQAVKAPTHAIPPPAYRIAPTLTLGPVDVYRIAGPDHRMQIEIRDMAGRIVRSLEHTSGRATLDLQGEADGTYMVSITTPQGRYTQRIVKSGSR
jgi:choice-of-anchor B domain-containing protein